MMTIMMFIMTIMKSMMLMMFMMTMTMSMTMMTPLQAREDMESFREMYERCEVQREERLNALKGKVKNCYKTEKDKHRQTKMAYDDVAPKAPRSVKVAQVKNGTFVATGSSLEGVKRARTSDPTAGKNMMGSRKPARAPLMAAARRMAGIRR